MQFSFREGEVLRIKNAKHADPQVIGEALEEIKAAHGGNLKPKDVVNAARDKSHPLHPHFEWNDKRAADKFRQDQARQLITLVCYCDPEDKRPPVQAYYSLKDAEGQSYKNVNDIQRSTNLQDALLVQLDRELEGMERRARSILDVTEVLGEARKKIAARLARMRNAAHPENRPPA